MQVSSNVGLGVKAAKLAAETSSSAALAFRDLPLVDLTMYGMAMIGCAPARVHGQRLPRGSRRPLGPCPVARFLVTRGRLRVQPLGVVS